MSCDGEMSVIWVSIFANTSVDAGCCEAHQMAGVYFIREQCYYALFFTFVIPGGSTAWHATELTELVPHLARGFNIN